jgi:flagellar FliJ protein
MKSFNFKLEKLLELKNHKEKEKAAELAEVTGRYANTLNKIESLKIKKKVILGTRFGDLGNSVKFIENEYQIGAINSKISELKKLLEKINEEKEEKRLKYVDALKDKKILEKLKEKQALEHKKAELSSAEKELDDIANSNFKFILEV